VWFWGNRFTIWRLHSARAAGSVATGILLAPTPSPRPSPKGRGSESREKCRGNALTRADLWQFGLILSITLPRDEPPRAKRVEYSPRGQTRGQSADKPWTRGRKRLLRKDLSGAKKIRENARTTRSWSLRTSLRETPRHGGQELSLAGASGYCEGVTRTGHEPWRKMREHWRERGSYKARTLARADARTLFGASRGKTSCWTRNTPGSAWPSHHPLPTGQGQEREKAKGRSEAGDRLPRRLVSLPANPGPRRPGRGCRGPVWLRIARC
jgi:hypothetical protein